ncbi:MAG TPA: radical SAM protein, partial [Blastocatellia bacterium]|nr:radical SAM protein [Blastocatellia bacterium]
MHIAFVHTPMATLPVPERQNFWRNFDIRYHAAHPGLRHMKNNLWELPHWMTWLAGVLVHEGYTSLDTVDFYTSETAFSGINQQKVHDTLLEHPADVYLFSPMTPNLPFAYEIADVIKAIDPGSVVVFGGVVATPLHREVAEHPSVDYVVYDRGEYALPALIKTLESKGDISKVGNLSYKGADGKVVTNPLKYPYTPVNEIPFPKVDLFPRSVGEDIRYLRQVYALGCPYKCSFCTIQTIGRKADYFAIDRVLAEIRAYRAHYGEHHNIYWGDETFTLNSQRTLELCAALEAEGNIFYDCQTRLNCLTDMKVIKALYKSGCRWIEIGLETGNQESQNLYKQRVKLDPVEDTLMKLRDEGLSTCSFMVNGFPNQTIDDMKRSIEWVCNLIGKDLLQASYLFGLVPYPGSDMYERPEKYGMKIHHKNFKLYHEEMPPVFDSAFAKPDETYQQFLRGVTELGQAMSAKPYFGQLP